MMLFIVFAIGSFYAFVIGGFIFNAYAYKSGAWLMFIIKSVILWLVWNWNSFAWSVNDGSYHKLCHYYLSVDDMTGDEYIKLCDTLHLVSSFDNGFSVFLIVWSIIVGWSLFEYRHERDKFLYHKFLDSKKGTSFSCREYEGFKISNKGRFKFFRDAYKIKSTY